MGTVVRRYSDAFKRAVVADVDSGRYTVKEAAAAHQIHFVLIYKWLRQLGSPESRRRIVRIEMPDEANRIKQLEEEKRALESALAKAHMKILLLESTVEVLEERAGRDAKKKPDTLSSDEPRAKDSV